MAITPNLGLNQPTVGGDENIWGGLLNSNATVLDAQYNVQQGPSVPVSGTSATAPGIDFQGDPNTGFYSPGADQIAATTGGVQRLLLTTSVLTLAATIVLNVNATNLQDGTTAAYRLVSETIYTTSQTINFPSWVRAFYAEVVGGGGAGGGSNGNGTNTVGGGGGGGGGFDRIFVTSSIPASVTLTIGAGGLGSTGASGGNGGTTSFGAYISATGGGGGNNGLANGTLQNYAPGAGGVGATFPGTGSSGESGYTFGSTSPTRGPAGAGGASGGTIGGAGAPGRYGSVTDNGLSATGYGGGGGGAQTASPSNNDRAGGNGRQGALLLRLYA